jgi:hypothetical protein
MVRRDPPDDCPSPLGPVRHALHADITLWRVHTSRYAPSGFKPAAARRSGRFDATDGDYGVLYLADDERTTLAEAFVRGDAVTGSVRVVPRKRIQDTRLSPVIVRRDLSLVSLIGGPALGRIGQDAWLTSCDEDDYDVTQRYARAIRRWAPSAAGLVWLSKRDNLHRAYVLFSDRVPADALEDGAGRALDDLGDPYAKVMLARLSVDLEDPVP